jgi:hypothetical protein
MMNIYGYRVFSMLNSLYDAAEYISCSLVQTLVVMLPYIV